MVGFVDPWGSSGLSILVQVDEIWPGGGNRIGVRDGIIADPESVSDPEVWRYPDHHVVGTPGWVCSHARLERTGLDPGVEPRDFAGFVDRIDAADRNRSPNRIQHSYRNGADALLRSGVCRVVDHCRRTETLEDLAASHPLAIHLFKQLEGFTSGARETALEQARRHLNPRGPGGRTHGGLAPRGPWCVHPELLVSLATVAAEHDAVLSVPLHESEQEIAFALEGTGPLRERIRRGEGRSPTSNPYRGRPIPKLVSEGLFVRMGFGVHLRHLVASDRRWIEASRMVPVLCPGQDRGAEVTSEDDRRWLLANTPFTLGLEPGRGADPPDMLQQLRTLHRAGPETPPERVLNGLTTRPTRVLGMPGRGVLTEGTPADLSLFDAPGGVKQLARGEARALAVIRGGEIVWEKEGVRVPG